MPSLRAGGLLLLIAVAPLATATLKAQELDPLSRLDANSRFSVERIIDSAGALGFPTRPLMSKALEGISKHADPRHIVDAVRRKFAALRDARAALGKVDDEDLVAGAAVLEAGVKPDQLTAFRNPPRDRSLLEAFTVWADLVTRGVPKDDASSAITRLWRGGAGDNDFYGLWNSVKADILQGLSPGAALQNRIREFPGRAPPDKGTQSSDQPETPSSR